MLLNFCQILTKNFWNFAKMQFKPERLITAAIPGDTATIPGDPGRSRTFSSSSNDPYSPAGPFFQRAQRNAQPACGRSPRPATPFGWSPAGLPSFSFEASGAALASASGFVSSSPSFFFPVKPGRMRSSGTSPVRSAFSSFATSSRLVAFAMASLIAAIVSSFPWASGSSSTTLRRRMNYPCF